MKRTATVATLAVLLFSVQIFTSCKRRPLEDFPDSAVIPVKIDWSRSNIPVSEDDPTGGTLVHRVALRFYPDDGSPIFERYLEGNIFEGNIEVPTGSYKVIVMNESIDDVRYWEDAITFSGADSFDDFAATVNTMPQVDLEARFPFYRPSAGENIVVEPLYLASWSLEDFEVTDGMVSSSRGYALRDGQPAEKVNDALTHIVMRGLTYNVTVSVHIYNLISVAALHTAAQGFADKVFMASGLTENAPSTHLFLLNRRIWDEGSQTDGIAQRTFLSFGRLPAEAEYHAALDILLADGELYTASGPMTYDVTDQVTSATDMNIDIRLPEDIELPFIEGGISVGEWDDSEITLM